MPPRRAELSKLLLEVLPAGLTKFFFTTSGTDANEAAFKIARMYTGKTKIISRYRSYHGSTSGSIAATGDPRRWAAEPAAKGHGVIFGPEVHCYKCPIGHTYPGCGIACVDYIEHMIRNESDVAAIIVEPIVGTNGVIVPPAEYMPKLRRVCDEYGVLMIADEVMSGWGRTGEWFAMNHWGVVPDILVTAKGITSAYVPLGLCATNEKIAAHFDDHYFAHGHTYEAHPITLAPAVATIREMQRLGLVQRARELESYMQVKLDDLKQRHVSIGDVRGKGLFWAVDLVKNRDSREPFNTYADKVSGKPLLVDQIAAKTLADGVTIQAWVSHFVLAPPLTTSTSSYTLPRFWTVNSIAAWKTLQNQLAAVYDKNTRLQGVAVSGCSSTTAEQFIHPIGSADVSVLKAAGFTDAQLQTCLSTMADQYAAWTVMPLDHTFNSFNAIDSGHAMTNTVYPVQVMDAWRALLGTSRGIVANHGLLSTLTADASAIYPEFTNLCPPLEFQTYGPSVDWNATIALGLTYYPVGNRNLVDDAGWRVCGNSACPIAAVGKRDPAVAQSCRCFFTLKGMSTDTQSYTRNSPYTSQMLVNYVMTDKDSEKETRHIELALDAGMTYIPGDAVGILPTNRESEVEAVLKVLNFKGDESVLDFFKKETTLDDALRTKLHIGKLTRGSVNAYAKVAPESVAGLDFLKGLAGQDNKSRAEEYVYGREFIDLITEYPCGITDPQQLFNVLQRLTPRMYSIASSQAKHADAVHTTVRVVRYHTHGSDRQGLCSGHMGERADVGETLPIFLHANANFRLPDDASAPVIMVGPGTGVAPFRAFLQHRQAHGHTGPNWLFFGEQRMASDFLYRDEFAAMQADGTLTRLDTAFSRDQQKKVYVQDRMKENATELFQWLERGAYFYVCGDASRMAKDVEQTLLDTIANGHNVSPDQAMEHLNEMKKAKRYQLDVY